MVTQGKMDRHKNYEEHDATELRVVNPGFIRSNEPSVEKALRACKAQRVTPLALLSIARTRNGAVIDMAWDVINVITVSKNDMNIKDKAARLFLASMQGDVEKACELLRKTADATIEDLVGDNLTLREVCDKVNMALDNVIDDFKEKKREEEALKDYHKRLNRITISKKKEEEE